MPMLLRGKSTLLAVIEQFSHFFLQKSFQQPQNAVTANHFCPDEKGYAPPVTTRSSMAYSKAACRLERW